MLDGLNLDINDFGLINEAHIEMHEAEETASIKTPSTCTSKGVTLYTATYDGHSETKEVEDIKKKYKKNPIDVLLDGFNGVHTILAHCVKLAEDDIEKIQGLDVHISTCPISNLKLGCGIANIQKMLECGINVSLGTDAQGSGSNLDIFETMKFTALLQKGIKENPIILSAYDVMKMATINGAKALCMEDKIGSIREGKRADIIILNMEDVIMKPTNNVISQIVYNAKGSNVDTTIVDGKILMENRVMKNGINESEIIEKCENIKRRISD